MKSIVPILTVLAALIAIWYAGAIYLNADWAQQQAARQDRVLTTSELVMETWNQDRPRLPAPHQVAVELWETTVEKKITSKRSLIYHGWVTLSVTLAGFGFGAALGIALAVAIVYSRTMDRSVMPLVIASQTIPILAIAPMIIVVLNSIGMQGFIPKAIIATYLSFFPITVGMVKGLRAPSGMQLDRQSSRARSAAVAAAAAAAAAAVDAEAGEGGWEAGERRAAAAGGCGQVPSFSSCS